MIPVIDLLPKGEGYDDPEEEKVGDEVDEDDTNINDFDEEDNYML
jgi:hypothetical protein